VEQFVVIYRGGCSYQQKMDNARAAGAVAVVMVDSLLSAGPTIMNIRFSSLPAIMINSSAGAKLAKDIGESSEWSDGALRRWFRLLTFASLQPTPRCSCQLAPPLDSPLTKSPNRPLV
jgi:hypothetical protein